MFFVLWTSLLKEWPDLKGIPGKKKPTQEKETTELKSTEHESTDINFSKRKSTDLEKHKRETKLPDRSKKMAIPAIDGKYTCIL